MKKRRGYLIILPIIIIAFIITGCAPKNKISDNQLIDYYSQSINGLAKVIDGYSQSISTGSNYVNEPANKEIKWINSTQDKLKKDNSGSNKPKYLSQFLGTVKDEIEEYKDNNFSDQESVSSTLGKKRVKLEKSLNVDDSTKVSNAKENVSKSWKNLKTVIASQPHVDGKKVINKNGEITFNSVNEIPGFEGEKTVEVKYTYKNTTDDPQAAYEALISSGDFTQDSDDSVNSLELGIADSDWEQSHPDDQQMYNDGTMSKLKSGQEKQYVTFLKVDNFDSPITFKATDSDTNSAIGKIKLTINK